MAVVRIKKTGSTLWGAVWKSWYAVRAGVSLAEPQTLQELMRQPLFGNPWITNEEGQLVGTEIGNKFANWAAKGLQQIKHI